MSLKTVLLDLDDTLLTTNTHRFISAYLERLSLALADFAPVEQVTSIVLNATGAIQANTDPDVTNHQAFYQAFLPHLNGSLDEVQPVFDRFYRETFPKLREYVTPRPHARPLIERLMADGYQIVVATNPLFPRAAIEQRMDWAGVLDFPYALITTMETMHYSKPNLDYYREVLTQVGASPERSLMVGDDPENDIAPARQLGLKTWQITDLANPAVPSAGDYQGTLAEFYRWMATNDERRTTNDE